MRHTYTTGSNRNFRQIKLSAIKFTIWTFIAQAPNKPSMRNLIVKSMIEGTKDTIKTIRRKKFTRTTLRCTFICLPSSREVDELSFWSYSHFLFRSVMQKMYTMMVMRKRFNCEEISRWPLWSSVEHPSEVKNRWVYDNHLLHQP